MNQERMQQPNRVGYNGNSGNAKRATSERGTIRQLFRNLKILSKDIVVKMMSCMLLTN